MANVAAKPMPEVKEYPKYPTIDDSRDSKAVAELIKRGEYLVKSGDCIACHTNPKHPDKPYAGGYPMATPFGIIYSPNLTPDRKTGIGSWSLEDFTKAMHEGISPKGHYYYPAFPYPYFNRIRHEDLKAMKAYLDRVPAVHQKNRDNEMIFPFNIRFLQWGWRILFFEFQKKGPFQPDPTQTEEWNRGAYFVQGLGHCAMCHTPSYHIISDRFSLGAPIHRYEFSGARIQGYLAPNISKRNLGSIENSEVLDVFKKDRLIGGGDVLGPMLEANHDSLSYMTDEDLNAMVTYLKTVESDNPNAGGHAGEGTYNGYCVGCHAMGSGGAPKFGDANAWKAPMAKGIEQLVHHAIHGIGGMPAKGTCLSCTDAQIKAAVLFMVDAAKNGSQEVLPTRVPRPKPLTILEGKTIYKTHCSVCHDTGFKGAPIPGKPAQWASSVNAGFDVMYQRAMNGYAHHPAKGACATCDGSEIKAALKYMLQKSAPGKDYRLW